MYPKLFGEHNWTMHLQIDENVTRTSHGKILNCGLYGKLAMAIEDIARAFHT